MCTATSSTDRVLVMEHFAGTRPDDTNTIDGEAIRPTRSSSRPSSGRCLSPPSEAGFSTATCTRATWWSYSTGISGCWTSELSRSSNLRFARRLETFSRLCRPIVTATWSWHFFKLIDLVADRLEWTDTRGSGSRLTGFFDRPLATIDVRDAINGMLELAARNNFSLPGPLVAFLKQILYISGICRTLEPDFDVLGDIAPIVALARQRATSCCVALPSDCEGGGTWRILKAVRSDDLRLFPDTNSRRARFWAQLEPSLPPSNNRQDRRVAVKALSPSLLSQPGFRERFRSEARL